MTTTKKSTPTATGHPLDSRPAGLVMMPMPKHRPAAFLTTEPPKPTPAPAPKATPAPRTPLKRG